MMIMMMSAAKNPYITRARVAVAFCLLLSCAAFFGCGDSKMVADSPKQTTRNFLGAIQAGEFQKAAAAFDYVTGAKKKNQDWDNIPSGQRRLILNKLQERKAEKLQRLQDFLGGNAKIETGADDNRVKVTGDVGSLTLAFIQRDGNWYISQMW